ncbi:aldehyde dehydrogenase family protein [Kineococcus rhizosphaerae]|uniref:Gamma-glutamyl-gamma-aminobutyraldehyde dehydrogenase n=1 Tax=Kineococcus rhizosphaerae TaxID=559628 RepID=A0A2T0R264_9ACTN|nr:aldehyde dehydrogenase family protein [Kineococcus rhizosphaerae]PRY13620.1 gamma-glutamyl-gamma-aminobutyraldehyde dehydrogenase [Kineococcus rhizosphaerae]
MTETTDEPAGRTAAQWHEIADRVTFPTRAVVGGELVEAEGGRTRADVDPATGRELSQVPDCSEADVDRAVRAARESFDRGVWRGRSPAERKRVLLRLAELIAAHADELAVLESLDTGKLVAATSTVDVPGSAAILAWYAESVDKVYGEVAPTAAGNLAVVTREPVGVVAAVVPWNYPLETAIWKLGPALAAGNSTVLKPAEESPSTALRLGELALEAGLPPGVLNVVTGSGPVVGRALGRHPGVDAIAFTGSTEVGRLFLGYSAETRVRRLQLELGGKSPNVVFADAADLDAVADGVCAGIFSNSGEVCSANSRLIVERSIADDLLALVVRKAHAFQPGDPLDPATGMGPLVSDRHAGKVLDLVAAGKETSTLLTGGEVAGPRRTFVQPTVFTDVDRRSRIATEEVFGPVLAAFTFETEEQALDLAHDTPYGLAASVWSDSLSRAHRVAAQLRAGTVSVNCVDALDVTTPFGGFGQSGFGRDLSLHAFDAYTHLKTTWFAYGATS